MLNIFKTHIRIFKTFFIYYYSTQLTFKYDTMLTEHDFRLDHVPLKVVQYDH